MTANAAAFAGLRGLTSTFFLAVMTIPEVGSAFIHFCGLGGGEGGLDSFFSSCFFLAFLIGVFFGTTLTAGGAAAGAVAGGGGTAALAGVAFFFIPLSLCLLLHILNKVVVFGDDGPVEVVPGCLFADFGVEVRKDFAGPVAGLFPFGIAGGVERFGQNQKAVPDIARGIDLFAVVDSQARLFNCF